jgi:dephospho-CoA kinase
VIILLNGPPGSGKDEVAKYLVSDYQFTRHRFAQPLIDAAVAFWGIDPSDYDAWKKRELSHEFTGRDWIIELAETVTKPRLGLGYFGQRTANAVLNDPSRLVVVSDAGFGIEVHTFLTTIRNSSSDQEIITWYLQRPGTSFSGDSRRKLAALDLSVLGLESQVIFNDRDLENLKNQVAQAIFWHFHKTTG